MKIYILHHNRYWTEYVEFLLSDRTRFGIVNSRAGAESYPGLPEAELFDPEKHKIILTPGRLHEPTHRNKIIMRFMHSPGFFTYPMLRAYAELKAKHSDSDYAFLILEEYYRAMVLREIADPAVDHFKHALMNDPKVHLLKVDPSMHKIYEAKKVVKREAGTGLLSLTWLLIDNDFSSFLNIARALKKELKVSLLLHPLMRMDEKYLAEIRAHEGSLFETIYYNIPRHELVNVYDKHEFVISDGSGSCYEAMARGCRPLAVRGLRNSTKDEPFNETLDEEYLPFPSYNEIASSPVYDNKVFLIKYFHYLYNFSYQEAVQIAAEEILTLPILQKIDN